jgi:hypothetical protein
MGLAEGLSKVIMKEIFNELIQARETVEDQIKKQKCFKHRRSTS